MSPDLADSARPAPSALVLLAPGAEEMEVTITVDVLRRGGVEVVLAGIDGDAPVTCSRGVRLLPDVALAAVADLNAFDVIVLPGGLGGMEALAASAEVGDLLRSRQAAGGAIAAICAAPVALKRHGVHAGAPMTCHPSARDEVATHAAYREAPVVEAPGLTTSQGPGTAFEFALALVRQLRGAAVADAVRAPMILP